MKQEGLSYPFPKLDKRAEHACPTRLTENR
jgi:hypothetical protein